ncbi:MAG: hypothetical protein KGH66_00125 [Candidatus Micrarchaeota archaeon]|nr:hypothetical protein [Candidatus Micrarchaeota archaeon]
MLATKAGVLDVNALVFVSQVNIIDSSGGFRGRENGILSLIRIGVRGGDLSRALEEGYAGDAVAFYKGLTSGNPMVRLERIGIRTDYNEFSLSSMLKA